MEEEADLAKADTTKNNLVTKILTTGKTLQTHEVELLEEVGAIMLGQANKRTLSTIDIVENLATTRQSITKRRVSQPSQTDNLLTTPQIPATTIVC